jgi:predicted nucleic acid-binding protein
MLSDVAHHLMTFEAATVFGWSTKVVQRLRRDPGAVQRLIKFHEAICKVPQLGIQVLTIPDPLIRAATLVSRQTGLLSNDALIVAVMQQHGLTNLASSDHDFDRVPGITRYEPG